MKRHRLSLIAALSTLALTMAACNSMPGGLDAPDFHQATRVPSPPADNPAGSAIDLGGVTAVDSVVSNGDVVAVAAGNRVTVGDLQALRGGSATTVELPGECGAPAASMHDHQAFVIACTEGESKGTVYLLQAGSKTPTPVMRAEAPLQTAVQLTDGRIAAAGGTEDVRIAQPAEDTQPADLVTIAMDNPVDHLVASHADAEGDGLVAINDSDTTIQGVALAEGKKGASLRIGTGVGRVAPGGPNMVIASNVPGNQLNVYTVDPVIRLHQSGLTQEGPWAVAWDAGRGVAWVQTTATNTVTAFRLSAGVPEAIGSLATPADATGVAVVDGNLIIGTASTPALSVVDAADVDAALDTDASTVARTTRG